MAVPLRVLLLEDSPADAELMMNELHHYGFDAECLRVDTEREFIRELEPSPDAPQIILSDYQLPSFNGLRALQLVRERGLDMPFILISGTIGEDLAVEALKRGATDYLLKDRMARLGPAVHAALEQHRLLAESRRAAGVLAEQDRRFRAMVENSGDGIVLLDGQGTVLYTSPAAERIIGGSAESRLGTFWLDRLHPDDLPAGALAFERLLRTPGGVASLEYRFRHLDGSWRWLETVGSNLLADPGVRAIVGNFRDVTERKNTRDALAASEAELRALFAAMTDIVVVLDAQGRYRHIAPTNRTGLSRTPDELLGRTVHEVMPAEEADQILETIRTALQAQQPRPVEYALTIGAAKVWFEATVSPLGTDQVIWVARDVTGRKRAAEALQASEERFRRFFELGLIGMLITSPAKGILEANAKVCEILGYEHAELLAKTWEELTHPDDLAADFAMFHQELDGTIDGYELDKRFIRKDGQIIDTTIASRVVRKPGAGIDYFVALVQDVSERKRAQDALLRSEQRYRQIFETSQEGIWVIDAANRTTLVNQRLADLFGYRSEEMLGKSLFDFMDAEGRTAARPGLERRRENVNVQADFRFKRKDGTDLWALLETSSLFDERSQYVGALAMLTDITERKRVEAQTQRHAARLSAQRNIDLAISGSFDLRTILQILLRQVVEQLGVDAASILLLDPASQRLDFGAGLGFRTKQLEHMSLRVGQGFRGRAALERRTVGIPNIAAVAAEVVPAPLLTDEAVVTYFGVPLLAKGRVKGVLEVFQRSPLEPDSEWMDFLEALAGQAAIAIDNAELFNGLQRSNVDLALAYDSTLEGWSHALDLRDKETEGHSRRVTELTVRLARESGMIGDELLQVRRGTLLHDIGKMGVPDHILLKPGPLTEDEWVAMRKHPYFAFELLSPIAFLRPALDIPYCHHEKWDGTGYPRGLKGEQIPLSARLFAIVDVWDALRSDRPYRAAWPADKVHAHIRSLSGSHFDPAVVSMFLDLVA